MVLAYVFWHRPATETVDAGDYERAQIAFHRSLTHRPPVGMRGSALLRAPELPWLPAPTGGESAGYEDWYLVDDFAALGVLNEAAVGRGHRTAHDRAAHHVGAGAGGLFGLHEGPGSATAPTPGHDGEMFAAVGVAVWVQRAPGSAEPALGALLGDGAEPGTASLWRRRLVLGPAPEFCLLAPEAPAGTAATRLPHGWRADTAVREVLYHS